MMTQMTQIEQLALSAVDNEAERMSADDRENNWHIQQAWDNAYIYCDTNGARIDEYRIALSQLFPWFSFSRLETNRD